MTIEKSPSPSANNANPAQSANRSDSAKGKTGNDEGSGGFGAILSAVDNAPAPTDTPADTSADASKAKAAVKGKPGAKADPTAIDPNTLLQQNPQIAAAQAQAAADAASAAAALNPQAAGTAQTAGDPATLAQQAALNATLAQQAALGQTGQTPTTVPGQLPGGVRVAGRGTPGAADSTVALDTTAGATPATAAHGLLQARAKSGKEALQADAGTQATQTSSQNNGQAAGSERADAAKFMASLEQAQSAQTNRAQESALAPLVAKSDKQQTSAPGQSAKSTDPTYSGTTLGVSGPDFSQSAVSTTGGVAPEMQVAEQVSYWVTHNVQNAELKLDGLGQDPVAVNISVQGNEAQISFRSDEQATRDMLQNSGAQLKDMLQREGLVLTGVSVGTSGSGDTQGRGQSSRQNVRQAQIAPLQAASQDSTPRLRNGVVSSAGRSVDLFV